MSNSVRPHRWQPTRLPHPWDSPGKNTGVGCHFLLQCMKVKSESEVALRVQLLVTPWTAAYQAPLSMGFSRQEYWSGVPSPSPNILTIPFKLKTRVESKKEVAVCTLSCVLCFFFLCCFMEKKLNKIFFLSLSISRSRKE